jgi:hypothetical protein
MGQISPFTAEAIVTDEEQKASLCGVAATYILLRLAALAN